jgi:hypothetical protein
MKSSILVVLVLVLAVPVFAQQGEDPIQAALVTVTSIDQMDMQQVAQAPLPAKPKDVVASFLGLTADQIVAWDKLMTTLGETLGPLHEQIKANGEQLREALKQTNPDALQVGTLVIKEKGLLEQVGAAEKKYLQDFESLLTTEQKIKLCFIRKADQAQPLFGPFTAVGLLPPK